MFASECFQSAAFLFWAWTAVGFYLCFLSSELFAPWFFRQIAPAYSKLSRPLYLEWNARWNSTIHAIIICICCISALAFQPHLWSDKLFSSDYFSEVIISLSSGYMFYDLITMPMYMSGFGLLTYYIHHGVAVIGSAIVVIRGFGKFYVHYKLLTELSTPFINLRWFLRQSDVPSKHPAVAISTLCFGIVFILVRWVSTIPFWIMFHQSVLQLDSQAKRDMVSAHSVYVYTFGIALDVLNVVWGSVILKLCLRAIRDLKQYRKENRGQIHA